VSWIDPEGTDGGDLIDLSGFSDCGGGTYVNEGTGCPQPQAYNTPPRQYEEWLVIKAGVNFAGVDSRLQELLRAVAEYFGLSYERSLTVTGGKESGPPHTANTAHARGLAVDIGRVGGVRFVDMNGASRQLYAMALKGAIIRTAGSMGVGVVELFGPSFAMRTDMTLSQESRTKLMAGHQDHVHISIRP